MPQLWQRRWEATAAAAAAAVPFAAALTPSIVRKLFIVNARIVVKGGEQKNIINSAADVDNNFKCKSAEQQRKIE